MNASLDDWKDQGEPLELRGIPSTRIWSVGTGPDVICIHGVPSSAYLYRKVISALGRHGLTGISLDFPGMGFAERPENFDYSWSNLANWLKQALNQASIDKFHLVVHDIGGPIGFDLIRHIPDRILSLTVLNTFVNVSKFSKPWVMKPFSVPLLGKIWTISMNTPLIVPFFKWKAVQNEPNYTEIRNYGRLLVREDGGRAFRKIMRNFETTVEFENRIIDSLKHRKFPAQIIWGKYDKELPHEKYVPTIKNAMQLETDEYLVDGKHFLQEDCYNEIAKEIAALVKSGIDR